jgi:hypothetical protein
VTRIWFRNALIAMCLAQACARATDEKLLGSGDDDSGGASGSAGRPTGGNAGFGGTPSSGGSAGRGGASTGGAAGKGGTSSGAGGASDGGASDGGEGGVDPCTVVGTPPEVRVDYKAGARQVTEEPGGEIRLQNETTAEIPLSELRFRYWFTSEFTCALTSDQFAVMIDDFRLQNPHVEKAKPDVTIRVVSLGTGAPGCDAYFELGFAAAAGSLEPNQYAAISYHSQIPIYDRTHSQTNDYSYGACTTNHVYWERITVYRDGRLVAGREPPGGGGGEGGAGGEGGGGMGGI